MITNSILGTLDHVVIPTETELRSVTDSDKLQSVLLQHSTNHFSELSETTFANSP